jgi:hypothetical protein
VVRTNCARGDAARPPLIVYFGGDDFWLADGFRRYRAAGVAEVLAEVRSGTLRNAVLYSVGANAAHGLRRSNEDKRRAVRTLLADGEWSEWSDHEFARTCAVSNNFASEQRKAICHPMTDTVGADVPAIRTVARGGTTFQQNVANIGKTGAPRTLSIKEVRC